jgi:DNA-directed RNA polymerase subunit RPC12/RpoP
MSKPRPARATKPFRKQQKGPGFKAKGNIYGFKRPSTPKAPAPILTKGTCQSCGYAISEEASAILIAAGHNQDLNCPECGGRIPFVSSSI